MRQVALVLALLLLGGCQVAPTLEVTGSNVSPMHRYDTRVALVVPEETRALRGASLLPTACLVAGLTIETEYGETFEQVVRDRLGRVFARVEPVPSLAGAGQYPLVFEARLGSVGYRLGCAISPETYVQLKASLRALDPQGREVWRSAISGKRRELPLMTFDPDGAIGQRTSAALGQLADDWIREFGDLGAERVAALMGQPVATVGSQPIAIGGPPARPVVAAPAPPRFSEQPLAVQFPRAPERPDDIAVIIGNADYTRQGRDIPDARPAHADAEGAKRYATSALGIKEGNIIFMKDATGAQMTRVFGTEKDPRGQLSDWVKPGKSRVFVYYSGHGAPGAQGGSPYLVPTDADAARLELNGFPVKLLYDNLGKLPAESVTVVLESCFSGVSPAGSVLGKASPVFFEVKPPPVPANVTVITAGAANQMASWEQDDSHGLFTKYFLTGMAGAADANKDGRVTLDELDRYLTDTLTYYARRHYGRDQNAQIVKGSAR